MSVRYCSKHCAYINVHDRQNCLSCEVDVLRGGWKINLRIKYVRYYLGDVMSAVKSIEEDKVD